MTRRYFEEENYTHDMQAVKPDEKEQRATQTGIFNNVKSDDLILLGIILSLLQGECRDKELLLVLGFLFISG